MFIQDESMYVLNSLTYLDLKFPEHGALRIPIASSVLLEG